MAKIKIGQIVLIALLLRLILLPFTYHGDITVTYWWGKFAQEFSLRGYYDWLNFGGYDRPDQPMINILYCLVIRHIYLFFYQIIWFINIKIPLFPSGIMTWYFNYGNQVLLKLPMILADIGLIYLVYRFIKKNFSLSKAKLAALVVAFYPPLIYNSAIWGSGDSIVNLLGLSSLLFFYYSQNIFGSVFFTVSILYKPSLAFLFPLVTIIFLKNKPNLKKFFQLFSPAVTIIYLTSRPFAIYNTFIWFIEIFFGQILPGCMHQLTSNAMNFWALLFGLKPQLDEVLIAGLISARNLSFIITLILFTPILINFFRHYSLFRFFLTITNLSLISFTFMTRMHERYTFPALIPLFVLCFYHPRFIKYFILLSLTHLLNVYNWWWYPAIDPLINLLKNDLFIRIISLTNLLITLKLFSIQLKSHEQT